MRLRNATLAALDPIVEQRRAMFREIGHRDPPRSAAPAASPANLSRTISEDLYHTILAEVKDCGIVAGGGGAIVVP